MSAAPAGVQQMPDSPGPVPRPRVVVRADLVPALRVLCAVAVLGLPLGWLWSRLAPAEIASVVAGPGSGEIGLSPLLGQSEHRFDAMATFVLFGLATGLLTGVGLWLVRSLRGPVVLLGAVLGSLAAAWFAMRFGLWLAGLRFPLAGLHLGEVVARAPVLESAWVVVAQPFGLAVVYSLAVSWHGGEDLGRIPS